MEGRRRTTILKIRQSVDLHEETYELFNNIDVLVIKDRSMKSQIVEESTNIYDISRLLECKYDDMHFTLLSCIEDHLYYIIGWKAILYSIYPFTTNLVGKLLTRRTIHGTIVVMQLYKMNGIYVPMDIDKKLFVETILNLMVR